MKMNSKQESYQRNDRTIWLAVASVLTGCALVSSASAATISETAVVPGGNNLAAQLSAFPGVQDNNRDYLNNQGPAGQTFQVGNNGTASSVTVMGRGDSASAWTTGPQPFDGTEVWDIQIGSVGVGGAITVLDNESATGFASAGANIADFLTFTLANPVAMTTGVTYEWTISVDGAGNLTHNPWFGLAHSVGDVFAGGYAMNNNTSLANPGGANGGATPVMGGFAAPNPNGYDYVFAVQGVPEPTTLALIGLGGLGLLAANRRRNA